jgi:hypothetical protein
VPPCTRCTQIAYLQERLAGLQLAPEGTADAITRTTQKDQQQAGGSRCQRLSALENQT